MKLGPPLRGDCRLDGLASQLMPKPERILLLHQHPKRKRLLDRQVRKIAETMVRTELSTESQ